MPCFNPISAYRTRAGDVVFTELKRHGDIVQNLKIACGQCHGCRLERSRQWAVRCVHEAQLHRRNCFITLTYDEEHIPHRSNLNHEDFQKFMKRLRKHNGPNKVRFYMGAEYGTLNNRPHFHACLFGTDFNDKKIHTRNHENKPIYTSETLQKLWPYGYSSIAELNFHTAAYIARYCMQKVTGQAAEEHYKRTDPNTGEIYHLTPEYNKMSLKPGIGAAWLDKYENDVYNYDHVIINGMEASPPKYYDKLLKRKNADRLAEIKEQREVTDPKQWLDNTPERLKVKEVVSKARTKSLLRGKI